MIINNENSKAIIVLCSELIINKEFNALSNEELSDLLFELKNKNIFLKDLMNFTLDDFDEKLDLPIKNKSKKEINKERLISLISRKGSIFFKVEELSNIGINIITIFDENYPKKILEKLKEKAPPLFYYAGDIELLNNDLIGFVGSKKVNIEEMDFTKNLVKEFNNQKKGIVSGGSKGIDFISIEESLENNSYGVEFLSDSMLTKLNNNKVVKSIQNNKLLLVSTSTPDSSFNPISVLEHNKYIYISSIKTMIIKSDYNEGGTWHGALENLKNNYVKSFCWDIDYKGNQELINLGIEPINMENKIINQQTLDDFN